MADDTSGLSRMPLRRMEQLDPRCDGCNRPSPFGMTCPDCTAVHIYLTNKASIEGEE